MSIEEKVVFGQSFEAVLRAHRPLEADLVDGLKQLGIPPDGPFAVAYPLGTYMAFLALFARVRYRDLDPMSAYTAIGQQFIRGYESTLIGRAMLAALRLIGPRRTVQRFTRSFRTANNYSELRYTELGPNEVEVWCNYVAQPGFYRGLLLEGINVAGGKNTEVVFVGKEGDSALYRIRWSA
ncbi:MAG: DUF2378 family protein [Myxococcaceae bacterium]